MFRLRQLGLLALAVMWSMASAQADVPREDRYGGTLVLYMHQIGTCTLDPALARGSQDRHLNEMLGDPLARIEPKTGEPMPALAASWTMEDGGRVWTFQLRDDVVFHDGTPFNAEAVKYNFDRAVRPEYIDAGGAAPWALAFDNYLGTEILGEYSLRVTFRDPHVLFLERMSDRFTMHSPTAMEQHGDRYGTAVMPVATGPFRMVDCDPDSHATLERNEEYTWGSPIFENTGPPYLDRLIMRGSAEGATRRAAFDSGEADMFYAAEADAVEYLDRSDVQVVLAGKAGTTRMFGMNTTLPPFDDIRVRQAFAHSIDREGILLSPRYMGVGSVAYTILSTNPNWPRDPAEMMDSNYLYDPERARELLEEAGWVLNAAGYYEKDGVVLEIDAKMPESMLEESEQMQAMAREVGFRVNLEVVSLGRWFEAQDRGELHTTPHSFSGPGLYLSQMVSGEAWYNFESPELDSLMAELAAEPDMERRLDLADRLQRFLIENAVVTPFVTDVYPFVMTDRVHGVFFPYTSWPLFQEAWLSN